MSLDQTCLRICDMAECFTLPFIYSLNLCITLESVQPLPWQLLSYFEIWWTSMWCHVGNWPQINKEMSALYTSPERRSLGHGIYWHLSQWCFQITMLKFFSLMKLDPRYTTWNLKSILLDQRDSTEGKMHALKSIFWVQIYIIMTRLEERSRILLSDLNEVSCLLGNEYKHLYIFKSKLVLMVREKFWN